MENTKIECPVCGKQLKLADFGYCCEECGFNHSGNENESKCDDK